jgi:TRAP-type C4-dicarboxylate transport system permease small subunit
VSAPAIESPAIAHASLNAPAPRPLRIVLDVIDRLGRLDGWIGGGCLITLTLLMLGEIGTRFLSNVFPFFPASLKIAWEYSSYLMAACFTFGAAMTLRAGGHIRVTLLVKNAPPALRFVLEAAAAFVALCFMAFLTYAMVRFTITSFGRGHVSTTTETPLWIPQTVVTFGMVLLTLQFLARLIQVFLGLPLEDPRMKASPSE